jgi:allantoinase
VSVSLHCEVAYILNAYTRLVAQDRALGGLRAYSAARPPHSEGLAVWIAAYLANEAHCVNVNLLHLSSRKALEAALTMAGVFPHIDFKREITVGHLLLDVDIEAASYAKVNPPIRPREDVEYLWRAVLDGKVDWIVSDHACCSQEVKGAGRGGHGDIWLAKSGFGGTEYLLAGVFSRGPSGACRPTGWPSCSPSIRRVATACWTRATSPSGSMPTWYCSTPSGISPSGRPTPRRARATHRSRARS